MELSSRWHAVLLVLGIAPYAVGAQHVPATDSGRGGGYPRSWTPRVAAGIVGTAAAVSLFDRPIADAVHRWHDRSTGDMQHAMQGVTDVGGVLPLAAGVTLLGLGAVSHNTFVRHLGSDVAEAVITSGLVTGVVKGLSGRARPNMSPDDPENYVLMGGFTGNRRASFPSGHTTAAFAAATVVAHELSRAHPRQSRWWYATLYGSAALVGGSRLYVNAHWASDVLAGAAIGTVSGLRVLRRTHRGP